MLLHCLHLLPKFFSEIPRPVTLSLFWPSWSSLSGQWDGNGKGSAILCESRQHSVFLKAGEAPWRASGSFCSSRPLLCARPPAGPPGRARWERVRVSEEPSPLPARLPPAPVPPAQLFCAALSQGGGHANKTDWNSAFPVWPHPWLPQRLFPTAS